MIALAFALVAGWSDVEPAELNDYVDCLYNGTEIRQLLTKNGRRARGAAVEAQLRSCSRLRAAGVKSLPFYQPRFQMIDANFRKSVLDAKD
ncbi:hypothetical protein SAMN05428950_101658 [Sphingomonas sp. OV641]|uniref:hypothetical protein n=1 Tax=Sphingomonas sp. OV641 TaxID=1881068 RepID=UPI0008D3228D|nr:hypothetical protein [Sphingomonas sp. OV641]SEI95151.1 hypothetical protein SAMN05428950_101658 [Sphingomonas sp. OV641]